MVGSPGVSGGTALFVLHYPAYGGPHNRVRRTWQPLADRGWRTILVLPAEAGNAADRLRAAGVEVLQTPLVRVRRVRDPRLHLSFLVRFRSDVRRLRRIIRGRSPDVVVVGTLANPQAALAAYLENTAVAWQIVDSMTPLPLRRAVMSIVRRLADAVIYGGAALEPLHLEGKPLTQPSCVIRPGVETQRFVPSASERAAVRRKYRIADDAYVVGTVANINPTKGIDDFLRAAACTLRALPAARHMVVGSAHEAHAGYLRTVREEQHRLGLTTDQVIFAGDREDVERYYAAMDVLAISSLPRSEGTTTTALEAAACGVPVVATRVGAVAEVVQEGVTGFLVDPCDPEALSKRVVQLLSNTRLRLQFGSAGRQLAQDAFDVSVVADAYRDAFAAAITHHRSRSRHGSFIRVRRAHASKMQ